MLFGADTSGHIAIWNLSFMRANSGQVLLTYDDGYQYDDDDGYYYYFDFNYYYFYYYVY